MQKGYYADITVFAPEKIKTQPDVPDFTPEGIVRVYANGKALLKDGEFLSEKAGRVLLKNR